METMQLKEGALLQGGKYRIESVLGQGGFGITYMALQTGLNRKVAIKEFFMKELCERATDTSHVSVPSSGSRELVEKFKTKFIKEAQTIAEMENDHIIRIHDVFEENGTAYYVMEFLQGGSLADSLPSGGFPEKVALKYIRQIADALRYIHEEKHILHLDVKPSNVMLRKAGVAVLIDFGISKHYDDEGGSQTSSTPVGVSKGYAPLEQYNTGGVSRFFPATDIYSLGATLYKLLTGQTPPDANNVYEDGLPELPESISAPVRTAVAKAMEPRRKDRPQSVGEFLQMLKVDAVGGGFDAGKREDIEELRETGFGDSDDETVVSVLDPKENISYSNGVLRVNGFEYPMVDVPGGTFSMGSKDGGWFSDQKPHDVTLSSYRIGKYEVTQGMWKVVMGDNPSRFTGDDALPVEMVSWDDCQEFLRKLNDLTGQNFKLPTEARWEFAARGGNSSKGTKYSGGSNLDSVGWYDDNSARQTHKVGEKSPNELGLYDMSGNVWEWCLDLYDSGYYKNSPSKDPCNLSSGSDRVCRGGSWYNSAGDCRVSYRNGNSPGSRGIYLGFRLCL